MDGGILSGLVEKVSSYKIFNYLFPGVVFAVLGTKLSPFDFLTSNLVVGAFIYYFYGLVVSRFGSLVLEPLILYLGLARFAPYSDFIEAAKVDPKVEVLSEQNNTYRTLAAASFVLLVLAVYDWVFFGLSVGTGILRLFGLSLLLGLFIWSYSKQTSYVRSRVEKVLAGRV